MSYIIIGLIVLVAVLAVVAFVFIKLCNKYKKRYEAERVKHECLQQEYSNLVNAYKIKKENKEKADAKVSDLHNGTTTADDILPKRKSRK
jgi:hypothetical protein